MPQRIVVHHLEKSRGNRAVWLMEELGVPYDIKMYHFNSFEFKADPSLKLVHPVGKSPVVTDKDGTVVAESGLIMEYFAEKYRQKADLWSDDKKELLNLKYDLYSAEANFMTAESMVIGNVRARQSVPMGVSFLLGQLLNVIESRWAGPELHRWLSLLDGNIANNNGFCCNGHFTVADIMYETNIFLLHEFNPSFLKNYDNINKWYEAMHDRPKYKSAHEKIKQAVNTQLAK